MTAYYEAARCPYPCDPEPVTPEPVDWLEPAKTLLRDASAFWNITDTTDRTVACVTALASEAQAATLIDIAQSLRKIALHLDSIDRGS